MKGYAFILGVYGYGTEHEPAYDEGIYLDYKKALAHLKALNKKIMAGYYTQEEIDKICQSQVNELWPKLNTYSMVEVEII